MSLCFTDILQYERNKSIVSNTAMLPTMLTLSEENLPSRTSAIHVLSFYNHVINFFILLKRHKCFKNNCFAAATVFIRLKAEQFLS